MHEYIERNKYLNRVKPYVKKSLIKFLVGQRRVGKSYLMFQIMDYVMLLENDANILYINTELNEFDHIKHYQNLYDFVKSKTLSGQTNYLFIDEIQNISEFENALKSFVAEGTYDIYCTGSNADLLSGELSTHLSGRYIEIHVYPLSYKEFLQFHTLTNNSENVHNYLKYGGLPYLKHLPLRDDIVFDYLKNIYQAILFKDIISRFNIRNVDFLERLVLFLAKHTGTVFSAGSIVKFLKSQNIKISVNSVLDYLKYLKTALFISDVSRTDIIGKRIFEVGDKYYFTDLGLRNALAGFSPFDMNLILENAVFNHLIFCDYKVLVGYINDFEIDFVAEKNAEKTYIQVAVRITDERTAEREFGNLLKIKDNFPKIIVTLDEYTGASYEGIRHIPLRVFLTEFE